jgi:hypothetical protein
MRQNLDRDLLPCFGPHLRLSHIGPEDLERHFLELWDTRSLPNKTINHVLGTLRVMLNETARTGLLRHNPVETVRPLRAET